jgi:hypothetical protein
MFAALIAAKLTLSLRSIVIDQDLNCAAEPGLAIGERIYDNFLAGHLFRSEIWIPVTIG